MLKTTLKVAHLTSVHSRFDTRIFLKECVSLSSNGYEVTLVVADGKGDECVNSVCILDVGSEKGRLNRIRKTPNRILNKAIELDAQVYHLHDPELMPIGLKLKKLGKVVIFDAHEDVPKQILAKPYLNKYTSKVLSVLFTIYEQWACRKLDAVVAATPYIQEKFKAMRVSTLDINNYPLLEELSTSEINWSIKKDQVCYIGDIAKVRGIHEMVKAMPFCNSDTRFAIGGIFSETNFEKTLKTEDGWLRVDFLGWLDRDKVKSVLNSSIAGLVTLHPIVNYLDALPVKMFEYMAAGIPVIASNFPLWEEIINEDKCGVCVDPLDSHAIASAVNYLVANPNECERMGQNGRRAVCEKYNWTIEERKLLKFYNEILGAYNKRN
jgi:glycosyltransferase involved in cell wall biosynthesis